MHHLTKHFFLLAKVKREYNVVFTHVHLTIAYCLQLIGVSLSDDCLEATLILEVTL